MSAVGGYHSRTYAKLEDLAETLDWTAAGSEEYETALKEYVGLLNALAALRGNHDPKPANHNPRWNRPPRSVAEQTTTPRKRPHNQPRAHSGVRAA